MFQGVVSSCLADTDLSETSGSVFTSVEAFTALRTANNGAYPTGAEISQLPSPYGNTSCSDDAEVTITPKTYNVFCNGDGTVAASIQY